MPLKIAALGATGQTGKHFLKQALERGHFVTALVRSPEKLAHLKHDNLKVVKANIFSENDLEKHFVDIDVVVSTLGFNFRQQPVT